MHYVLSGMAKIDIKTLNNGVVTKHDDEIIVEFVSALGIARGMLIMSAKMQKNLIDAYIDSGTVTSMYMYIDGKEITDGKDHNPYHGI